MPPKKISKFGKIQASLKKAGNVAEKEQVKGLTKAQKDVEKGPYKPQVQKNVFLIQKKAAEKELEKLNDIKFFKKISKEKDEENITALLTEYIQENPSRKQLLEEIQKFLPTNLLKKFAKKFEKKNQFLDVFWKTYKTKPDVKEAIFAKKEEEEDALYSMRVALGQQPEDTRKPDIKKKYYKLDLPAEKRIVYSCLEEMRRGNWLDTQIIDTFIDKAVLGESYKIANLYDNSLEYDNITWFNATQGYFKLLCNPNTDFYWKDNKMHITTPDITEPTPIRVLYTTTKEPFEQTEYTFLQFLKYRERLFEQRVCTKYIRKAEWMGQPIKSMYIAPVDDNDISMYIKPNSEPINSVGYTWNKPNSSFYELFCNKFSGEMSQSSDVLTLYAAKDIPVLLHVAYMTRTNNLIVQDEAIFDKYVEYTRRPRIDDKCKDLWRKVPWMPFSVRAVYLNPIKGSDIRMFINNSGSIHQQLDEYPANDTFFRVMCDNTIPKKQVGTTMEITIAGKSLKMQVLYKPSHTEKVWFQNEQNFAKMMEYINDSLKDIKVLSTKKLENFLSSPVSKQTEEFIRVMVSDMLNEAVPENMDFKPINGTYSDFIVQVVNVFDKSSTREFLQDYANLVVFLSPYINGVGGKIFLDKLKNAEYEPEKLGKLSFSEKLPEVFDNPYYPNDKRKFIESSILDKIQLIVRDIASKIESSSDPSARKPTRPKHYENLHVPLACVNDIDMQGISYQDIVYYDTDFGQKYCLLVSDVINSIIEAETNGLPVSIKVVVSGKNTTIPLSETFLEIFKKIYEYKLVEKRTENAEKPLIIKFEEKNVEQPKPTDIELAPGLLELIKENIRELLDEDEEYKPGEDPEGNKIKKYPCWYCAKIVRGEGSFKTIIYSNKEYVQAHFCSAKCLEEQDKWPQPKPPKIREEKKEEKKEEKFDIAEHVGKIWEEKEKKSEVKEKEEKSTKVVRKHHPKDITISQVLPKAVEQNPKELAKEMYDELGTLKLVKDKDWDSFLVLLESKVPKNLEKEEKEQLKKKIEDEYRILAKETRKLTPEEEKQRKIAEKQEKAYEKRQKGEGKEKKFSLKETEEEEKRRLDEKIKEFEKVKNPIEDVKPSHKKLEDIHKETQDNLRDQRLKWIAQNKLESAAKKKEESELSEQQLKELRQSRRLEFKLRNKKQEKEEEKLDALLEKIENLEKKEKKK